MEPVLYLLSLNYNVFEELLIMEQLILSEKIFKLGWQIIISFFVYDCRLQLQLMIVW